MNKRQKEALLQFMHNVLYRLHPDFDKYPIQEMKSVRYSRGEEFEGTSYEQSDDWLNAFFLNDSIEIIEKEEEYIKWQKQ